MVYGITLSKLAENPEWGIRFIEFLLSKQGQKVMEGNGQPEIIPPRVDFYERLPERIKGFFKQ
jgi:ABC-type Fe3+ transport system substrate-binding protein